MTTSYSTLITTHGLSLLAMAQAGGATISLTQMALGDGNGTVPTPSAAQTALVHEVYRAALNSLAPDSNNPPYIVAEMVIPTTVGGFTVTEVGLFDSAGNLFCVGNFPSTYKPVLAEGSARDLVIRVIMEVGNAASVQLLIDPAVVLASRGWVQSLFAPLSGAAFTGNVSTTANVTASALLTANIAIVGGQIYETATNGNAALAVNYTGYQAGTTQYRDFSINDGKQNLIASFIGATHSINLHGGVTVNANTGVAPQVYLQTPDWNSMTAGSGLLLTTAAASGNSSSLLQAYTAGSSATGTLALNPNGGAVTVGAGGLSATGNVTGSALLTANIAIVGGQIYETATNGNAALAVNYTGYQAGTTQYRDFSINDGKQNLIASFIGATHSINLHGGVTVNANTGVAPQVYLQTPDWNSMTAGSGLLLTTAAASGNSSSLLQAYTAGSSATGTLALNPNGGAVTVGAGGLSATGNVTGSALLTANIAIVGGQIYETATNGNAALAVNYTGYQAGTTQYRDFTINDGKQSVIASFIGATHAINLSGNVTMAGSLSVSSGLANSLTISGSATNPTIGTTAGDIVHTAHIASSAGTPSTSYGTISGTDQSGLLTLGSSTVTSLSVTFGTAYRNAPKSVMLTPANATAAATGTTGAYVSAVSTTGFTITGSNLGSTAYYYHVF